MLRPGISSKNPIEPAGAAQASKGGPTKDKRERRGRGQQSAGGAEARNIAGRGDEGVRTGLSIGAVY